MKTSLLGGLSNNVQFLFTVARGFGEFLHSKKEHPINTGAVELSLEIAFSAACAMFALRIASIA